MNETAQERILVGTAGWSLPRAEHGHFPALGSHLQRYATRFAAVEINSSFRRSHKSAIWKRWRDAVPPDFRFSVKIPKTITHIARLDVTTDTLGAFIEEISVLGPKLRCLLVQLPPSLVFDTSVAPKFFKNLLAATSASIACEPRNDSWFEREADAFLRDFGIARVAADPARVPAAADPGGTRDLSYFRLHGSPKVYYSAYTDDFVSRLADRLWHEAAKAKTVWCIFDNTTLGAATRNALDLSRALSRISTS